MTDHRELEYKLAIRAEDVAAFRRLPLLKSLRVIGPTRRKMLNIYFDTPGRKLGEERMALRLRKSGGKWLQTLKTADAGGHGMFARGEWEQAVPGPVLDLSLLRDTPLAKFARRSGFHTELQAVFQTDFYRTAWLLDLGPGRRVEVALDLGEIRCGERSEAISEVEIELMEGDADAVFEMAAMLTEQLHLQPATLSKAERGYRLLAQEPPAPRRAQAVEIKRKHSPELALQAMLSECLAHFENNVSGALDSVDPEYIHQLRVALRRMRSALRVFPLIDSEDFIAEVKWLAAALGAARDWDVFVEKILPPLSAAYADPAITRRLTTASRRNQRNARATAREALLSQPHAHLALSVSRWLHVPGALRLQSKADPAAADTADIPALAEKEIRRRQRQLLRDTTQLATQSSQQQHLVRIDAKRLRYALEFFQKLYPKGDEMRYARLLGSIQDLLGDSNDDAVALTLLESLAMPPAFVSFARGWAAARAQANTARLTEKLEALKKFSRKWPGKAKKESGDAIQESTKAN